MKTIPGKYYISNIDNQIHNSNDVLHNIIEGKKYIEISIINSDGCEIDKCCLYNSLNELLLEIFGESK